MGDVDQAKLEKALIDAVFRLCGTFLPHADSIEVRGLLGITLDKSNIVWVDLKEEQEGTVVKTSQPVPRGRGRRTRSKGKVVDSENALASTVDASDEYISLELAVHGEVDSDDIPPEDPDFEHETPQRKRRKRGNPAWTPKPKGGRRVETATKTDTQALVVKTEPDSFIKSMEDDDESDAGEALYDEEPPVPSESFDMSLGVGSMEPDGSISVMLDPSEDLEADDDDDVKKLETNDDDDDEDDEEPSTSTAGHVELDASTGEIMVIPGESKPVRIVSGAVNKRFIVTKKGLQEKKPLYSARMIQPKTEKTSTNPWQSDIFDGSSVEEGSSLCMPGQVDQYRCPLCDMKFKTKSELNSHDHAAHRGKPLDCSKCDRKFMSKAGLLYHNREHLGIYPYLCGLCDKGFHTKRKYDSHMNAHLGRFDYICEKCGKRYCSSDSVRYHEKFCGITERPHACSVCNKSFKSIKYLKEHQMIHTHPYRYSCPYCDMKFTARGSLLKHKKRKHSDAAN